MKWATFAAVVVTVLAAFAGLMYLRFSNDTVRAPVCSGCSPAVIAARDIPFGTRIQAEMLTTRSVPDNQLAPYAFDDMVKVVGQVANVGLAKGEQVTCYKVRSGCQTLPTFRTNLPLTLQ